MAKARTDAPSTAEKVVEGGDPIKPDTQPADAADARVAALEAQLAEARATTERERQQFEQRLRAIQQQHDEYCGDMRAAFRRDWDNREREIERLVVQHRGPAVGGSLVTGRRVAVGWVRAHRDGKPVTYQPGSEIHDDADLTGVHADAITTRER